MRPIGGPTRGAQYTPPVYPSLITHGGTLFVRFVLALAGLATVLTPAITAAEITSPRLKWTIQTDGPIRGAAAVAGGAVYVGSADGHVYAVAKDSGLTRWTFDTGGAIAGAPAIAGSTLVVAGRSEYVYALDTVAGTPKWQFRMAALVPADIEWDYFTAAPVIADDLVLIGSGDGHLYALDLASGDLRWRFRTADRIRATPLVVDGVVYQPSGDDVVYALSAADGTLRWKFETEGTKLDRSQGFIRSDIFTRPALQGGLLVFGARDGNVYAVDAATGQKQWNFAYGSTWAMSTAADADAVYAGWSTNNMISAHDLRTGALKWEFKADAHTYTTALILGDQTWWGSADGRIYGLDRTTGDRTLVYDVGREVYSSLVHDDGTLYFGADDGRLYALSDRPVGHRAVYQPTSIPTSTGSLLADDGILPYLAERGFDQLGSTAALEGFLTARIADEAPSVVVFALTHVPQAMLGDDPATGLLRRYLDAGGRVVWPGGIPNAHAFGEDDTYLGRDPDRGTRLLGVEVVWPEDGGNYAASPTRAGRDLGLPRLLKNSYAVVLDPAQVTALSHDEYGRVGGWMKTFHPRPGSGFISLRTWGFNVPARADDLALLADIASRGLD